MLAWMKGGRDWREPFLWNNIGPQFADGETDESVPVACPSGGSRTVNGGDSREINSDLGR